jgi:hypothetical protein
MRPKPWPAASSIRPVDASKLVKRLSALVPRVINNVVFDRAVALSRCRPYLRDGTLVCSG